MSRLTTETAVVLGEAPGSQRGAHRLNPDR